jgi:hypothetical protein
VRAQTSRFLTKDPSAEQIAEFLKVVNETEPASLRPLRGWPAPHGSDGRIYRFQQLSLDTRSVYAEMLTRLLRPNGHGGQKKFVESYAQQMNSVDTAATSTTTKQ